MDEKHLDRVERAMGILRNGYVKKVPTEVEIYKVCSSRDKQSYQVLHNTRLNEWKCECKDFKYNEVKKCKHIYACIIEDGLD